MLLTAADDYRPDAQKSDIIKGYGDGQLHEEQPVTRAEALIMLTRAFGEFPELKGNNLRRALPRDCLLYTSRGHWQRQPADHPGPFLGPWS